MGARQKVIAGNWKMHKMIGDVKEFFSSLAPMLSACENQVLIAAPFTVLWHAAEQAKALPVIIGAQNINDHAKGAFTGEISAGMVKDAGAKFVILGHSERRRLFHEDSCLINSKVKSALKEGLQPLVCIGETLDEREAGNTESVLKEQIEVSLKDLTAQELESIMLAYEPVWAIGANLPATAQIVHQVHHFCRKQIKNLANECIADAMPILYGGAVNEGNAQQLLEVDDVNGLLIGGASLAAESFGKIANCRIVSNIS